MGGRAKCSTCPVWEIALINATHLGVGQDNVRFRWVPYADPLLWPFAGERSSLLYSGGPSSIAQLLKESQVATLPATLEAYQSHVVETQHLHGGRLAEPSQ